MITLKQLNWSKGLKRIYWVLVFIPMIAYLTFILCFYLFYCYRDYIAHKDALIELHNISTSIDNMTDVNNISWGFFDYAIENKIIDYKLHYERSHNRKYKGPRPVSVFDEDNINDYDKQAENIIKNISRYKPTKYNWRYAPSIYGVHSSYECKQIPHTHTKLPLYNEYFRLINKYQRKQAIVDKYENIFTGNTNSKTGILLIYFIYGLFILIAPPLLWFIIHIIIWPFIKYILHILWLIIKYIGEGFQ
jgi:hypothetical protein